MFVTKNGKLFIQISGKSTHILIVRGNVYESIGVGIQLFGKLLADFTRGFLHHDYFNQQNKRGYPENNSRYNPNTLQSNHLLYIFFAENNRADSRCDCDFTE